MTTDEEELREDFWAENIALSVKYAAYRFRSARQNDYPADARLAWCDFVESCVRDGRITEELARTVTL